MRWCGVPILGGVFIQCVGSLSRHGTVPSVSLRQVASGGCSSPRSSKQSPTIVRLAASCGVVARLCLPRGFYVVAPTPQPHHTTEQHKRRQMELTIKDCADNLYVIEVGVDDTTETMRQKVATAAGLAEDSFHMGFGGKEEGEDITQLSAGDTVVLTKTKKQEALAELHALGETDITAERLETVEDPVVACLLLQAEVATVIPNRFLAYTTLTTLDLSAVSCVTEIGDYFLGECATLTSINLSGLCNVTRIGESFLSGTGLTELDLSPLSRIAHIDAYFLLGCRSLTELDLSPLCNVTDIRRCFLSNCESLTALNMSPLRNVTTVGGWFLKGCSGLTELDLSPLSRIAHIGGYFLANCSGLTELDLTPLSNVTQIGKSFLANCSSLTVLDLSPLSAVMDMGALPAVRYTSLKSIHLSGCSSAVSSRVQESNLKELVDARPKRSRDESPEQCRKRRRGSE